MAFFRAGAAFTQVVRHFHPRSSYMPKLGIPQKILKYALSEIESEGIFMFQTSLHILLWNNNFY